MKFTCVSYTSYTHSLRVILYNILNNFVHETKFVHMSDVIVDTQKVMDFGAFQVRDAQSLMQDITLGFEIRPRALIKESYDQKKKLVEQPRLISLCPVPW